MHGDTGAPFGLRLEPQGPSASSRKRRDPVASRQQAGVSADPVGGHLGLCSKAEYSVSDTREASMSLVRPVLAEYLKMKAFISS